MFMFACAVMIDVGVSAALPLTDDPLPPAALVRFGTTRFGHFDPITWVGFTPDGKTVLTASGSHIRFWDTATRRELGRQHGGWAVRDTFALSADSKKLALWHTDDKQLIILDVVTRKEIRRFTGEEIFGSNENRQGQRFILSPDGRFMAAGNMRVAHWRRGEDEPPGFLHLWETGSGRRVREWKTGDAQHAEFTADRKALIAYEWDQASMKSMVRSWDLSSGKDVRRVELPRRLARFVCLPDGKSILGLSHDRESLHRYEIATGKELDIISDNGGAHFAFALSPDGQTLALAQPNRVVVKRMGESKTVLTAAFPRDFHSPHCTKLCLVPRDPDYV